MNKEVLEKYIANESVTIVEAMGLIDANAKGFLFVVDQDEKLIGSVTDGDIRRWILATGNLSASISHAMRLTPVYLDDTNRKDAFQCMIERQITALPIVDSNKCVVDIIIRSDLYGDGVGKKSRDSLENVPVVIMAGGKGTRLYPYTKILPKPLIPVDETPIVERIIDAFSEYGVKTVYMTVNYKKNMIKSYFDELEASYTVRFVDEDVPLGTGGSLTLIDDNFDKPLIVTNCDTLIMTDYEELYNHHLKSGNVITVVSALKNITVPYGVLRLGEKGSLCGVDEKPQLSYFINTGMYVINPEMIDIIPKDKEYHMTDLIESAVASGLQVGSYPISEDSFLDMGEFGEMKRMEEKLQVLSK